MCSPALVRSTTSPTQELIILPAPGEVLMFSGNQLHASTPNTSGRARFSVDFRTVDVPDLVAGRGAALVDAYCTGTAIRDFINVADESSFDEQTVDRAVRRTPGRCDARVRQPAAEGLIRARGITAAGRISYACEVGSPRGEQLWRRDEACSGSVSVT